MDNKTCIKCGTADPEHVLRYFAVRQNANVTPSSSIGDLVAGAERITVCDRCIQKQRRSDAIGSGIGHLFMAFFGGLMLSAAFIGITPSGKRYFNSHVAGIFTVVILFAVASAIYFFVKALHRETPFVGAKLLKKLRGAAANGIVYVPADKNLYWGKNGNQPDGNAFKEKNRLPAGIGDAVFLLLIAEGKGDEIVDEIIDKPAGSEGAGENAAPKTGVRKEQNAPVAASPDSGNNMTKESAGRTESKQTISIKPSLKTPGGKIRHISCLCWDAPYINSLKGEMQEYILRAEQERGSEITPTSRISFDSFYDNRDLENPDKIRQKLIMTYMSVYPNAEALADRTIAREVRQKDGHTLVRYFVLYEDSWNQLVDKLAHYQSLGLDRAEESAMGEELLRGGDAALQAIMTYLLSCASGRQSDYWWSNAAYLVKLIAKFPGADHEALYKKLMEPETNIWEYHTQIKDVAQQELLNLKKRAPDYESTTISPENAQAELKALYNGYGDVDERLRRAVGMRASSENWSDADKAFYYYIIGYLLQQRDKNDDRRLAFYAAQVFYQPINTSLGWYELKRTNEYKDVSPSPENAKMLHEKLPLPEEWEDLLTH